MAMKWKVAEVFHDLCHSHHQRIFALAVLAVQEGWLFSETKAARCPKKRVAPLLERILGIFVVEPSFPIGDDVLGAFAFDRPCH